MVHFNVNQCQRVTSSDKFTVSPHYNISVVEGFWNTFWIPLEEREKVETPLMRKSIFP